MEVRKSDGREEGAYRLDERRHDTRKPENRAKDSYRPDYYNKAKYDPWQDNQAHVPEHRATKDSYRPDYHHKTQQQGADDDAIRKTYDDNRARDPYSHPRTENIKAIKTEDGLQDETRTTAQDDNNKPRQPSSLDRLPESMRKLLANAPRNEAVKKMRERRPVASDFFDGASDRA
jgi:hypothetical protein